MSPMTDLRVRPATPADHAVLASLAERLAAVPLPAWRLPGDIAAADAGAMVDAVAAGRADNVVVVAERGPEVVGCLHLLVTTDFFGLRHAHVSVLATTAAAEGTGVGRALLAYAEEWTAARGLPLLTLNVFDRNARARRFYEQSGFEVEMVKYAKRVSGE
jgi:GNAT superfamily N-acetyltransferase